MNDLPDETHSDQVANRRETHWRLVKEIPISVIVVLVGVILANVISYFVFQDRMQVYIEERDKYFSEYIIRIEKRFTTVEESIRVGTKERIYKNEALEMFKVRDVQIDAVNSNILDIKSRVNDINTQMTQLRRDLFNNSNGIKR